VLGCRRRGRVRCIVANVLANGYGDGEMRKDNEEDSSSNFFASGEGAIIPDCLSLCVASESGQSGRGSGTEDDPVSPEIPTAAHDPT
jgi:hypothetical protein